MTAIGGPGVFRIVGIADFREILRRFREVDDAAARTGANVGANLSRGGRDAFRDLPAGARTASEAAGAALTPLRNALLNLTAGVSLVALFRGAINEAVQLETITRKLSNTLGAQGAGTALAFTRNLSDELGLSFKVLAGSFGSFTAAASAANVPIQVQRDLFAAVSKSAQSLGLSNDELNGSLLALQQVASKGTVQMEELRGQLGERLPVAFGATARGLGITQQQLIKLVETGKLTADQFFPALTKGLNELSSGSTGPLTAAQSFAVLTNELERLRGSVGEELLPGVLAFVQALSGGLQGPIQNELNSVNNAIAFLQEQIKEQTEFGLDTTEAQRKLGELQIKAEELKTDLANVNRESEIKVEVLDLEKQRRELERQGVATDAVTQKIRELSQELFLLNGSTEEVRIGRIFTGFGNDEIRLVPQLTEELKKAKSEQDQINESLEVQRAARERLITAGRDTAAVDARINKLQEQREQIQKGVGLAQQDVNAQKKDEEIRQENLRKAKQKELDIEKARVRAAAELNAIRAQEPVRALDSQLAVGQGLLQFAQAAAGLEQARFDTVRARNQFEIDNAQQLGLTQEQIAQRQQANDEIKRQALIAQYRTLLQTQAVEGAILALSQRKATVEAQIGVIQAQQAAVRAQQAVLDAQASGDATRIGQAQAALALSQENVRLAGERLTLLTRTQPLEAAAAQAAAETAREQLRTQGASLGIEQALLRIAPAQQVNNTAFQKTQELIASLPQTLGTVGGSVEQVGQNAGTVVEAFKDASGAITALSKTASDAGSNAEQLGDRVGEAKENAEGLQSTGIDQVVNRAAGAAKTFADNMRNAATSAQQLLQYLSSAAGLSPARFTGGPVEAGRQYRINDGPGGRSLGREAFLSAAGRLSLINAPANSLWTAPTSGTVIPAAMTRQLTDAGLVGPHASVVASHHAVAMQGRRQRATASPGRAPIVRRGPDPTMARLELAVTNLAGQVKALTQKEWTVPVHVRNSAGMTQLRVLNGLV